MSSINLTKGIATLVILAVAWTAGLAQKTYYVASTGNDASDGQSAATAIRSLDRVNALVLQPGDAVLFRRGDTFIGTLRIRQSGSAQQPIRFDAYGIGPKPIMSGAVPVTNWTQTGQARWQASCPTCGSAVTGLYQNGMSLPLGRYPNPDAPNRGYLTVQAHMGGTQLSSLEPLTVNWTGAEVVLRPTYWIIDRARISQQRGSVLTLANSSGYSLTDNWGFFIQNHPATLDQAGEWYYDPQTHLIQLYADRENPNNQRITATVIDRVVAIENASFIILQNLHIQQARATGLYVQNGSTISLINDDFTDSGEDGVTMLGTGTAILVDNSTISHCANNGFYIGAYQHVTFRRSRIRNIGLVPGRGKSGDGQYNAFQSQATQHTVVENNVIDSIGYNGISAGANTQIRQNLVSNFCMTKSDGGGIYLWNGNQLAKQGIQIESNIVQQGIGTVGGLADVVLSGAHGIFLDDCVDGVSLSGNTVMNCNGLGIYLHAVKNVDLANNTCYNNSIGQLILYRYNVPCLPRNNRLTNNILVARTAAQSVVGYITSENDLRDFGVMAHNYYARPFYDVSTIRAVYNQNQVSDLSLPQWQSQFGQDLSSKASPLTFRDYKVVWQSTTDLINSSFTSDQETWDTWSPYNNGQAVWGRSGGIDGGGLNLKFPKSSDQSNSYMLAYKSIPAVKKAKTYLLRFDAASSAANKTVTIFIRQRQAPYQDLTLRQDVLVGTRQQHYEVPFTIRADEPDALLTFQLSEDNQVLSLNNIYLHEATVTAVDPDEVIRLAYNPTPTDTVVVVNKPYRDLKNHYYARSVRLKPFASVLLLADTLPPQDVSLSMRIDRPVLRVGEVASLSVTLHNDGSDRQTVAGAVTWRCRLPDNLTGITRLGGSWRLDSVLTGTVQQLRTDSTFIVQIRAVGSGSYAVAAQVTATTLADPDSTPDSGLNDSEDDQARLTLLVHEAAPLDTTHLITAVEPLVLVNRVYPNPSQDGFSFVAESDILTFRLTDMLGRECYALSDIRRGQTIVFGDQVTTGYYLLSILYASGERRTVKLIKSGAKLL